MYSLFYSCFLLTVYSKKSFFWPVCHMILQFPPWPLRQKITSQVRAEVNKQTPCTETNDKCKLSHHNSWNKTNKQESGGDVNQRTVSHKPSGCNTVVKGLEGAATLASNSAVTCGMDMVQACSRKPPTQNHMAFIVAAFNGLVLTSTKTIPVLIWIPKLKECLNLDQIAQNKRARADQIGMWYGLSRIPTINVILSSFVTCKEMHVMYTQS